MAPLPWYSGGCDKHLGSVPNGGRAGPVPAAPHMRPIGLPVVVMPALPRCCQHLRSQRTSCMQHLPAPPPARSLELCNAPPHSALLPPLHASFKFHTMGCCLPCTALFSPLRVRPRRRTADNPSTILLHTPTGTHVTRWQWPVLGGEASHAPQGRSGLCCQGGGERISG